MPITVEGFAPGSLAVMVSQLPGDTPDFFYTHLTAPAYHLPLKHTCGKALRVVEHTGQMA